MSGSGRGDGSAAGRVVPALVCFAVALGLAALIVVAQVASGASAATASSGARTPGMATPVRCWSDGPFLLRFWERCELKVRWQDGSTSRETSTYADFSSADIGERIPVRGGEVLMSQGQSARDTVVRDVDHPWAWLGWVLLVPLGLGALIFAITGLVFVLPQSGKKKRR